MVTNDPRTKTSELAKMKDQISWKKSRYDRSGPTRTWWNSSRDRPNGGPGPHGMTIEQCCEALWEKYNVNWRGKVKLRKPNEATNFP